MDFDLDVMSALSGFPEDDINSFIYIRGMFDRNNSKIKPGFIHTKATPETISSMIYSFIKHSDDSKAAIFNAVLAFLNKDMDEDGRKLFISHLKGC